MASFLERDLAPSRRMKAKLRAGEVTTLCHSSHPSPSLVERLAQCGFDSVLIDCEHGSVGRERVEEMSRAAALAGTAAILRPEGSLPHLVTGYLGCGVDGFMLPLISSPAQARELVDVFRFSAPVDHEDRVLIMMIEHLDAVQNLPALLALEGVDAWMVAPWDLALTMGEKLQKGQPLSPRVTQMIDRAIDTIVSAGRVCGMRVDHSSLEKFLGKGVTLVYDHADNMLRRGAKDFLGTIATFERKVA